MPEKSKRIYPAVSSHVYNRLSECAKEHGYFKDDGETPNVSQFVTELLRFFLNLDRMDGMSDYKSKDGCTTLEASRRGAYYLLNPEDDEETERHKNRHLN